MVETIEIEILRPVNPTGVSFMRYIYGAVAARERDIITTHKKKFVKLMQKLGFLIEDKVGSGKLITGKIIIEVDENKEPIKAIAENIKVWNVVKEIKERIEAEE